MRFCACIAPSMLWGGYRAHWRRNRILPDDLQSLRGDKLTRIFLPIAALAAALYWHRPGIGDPGCYRHWGKTYADVSMSILHGTPHHVLGKHRMPDKCRSTHRLARPDL